MGAHSQGPAQHPRLKSSLLLAEVDGQTTRCHVFKPQKSSSTSNTQDGASKGSKAQSSVSSSRSKDGERTQKADGAAVLMLSDIFGCDTNDNLQMCQRLADDLQCPVYMPDIFRGEPWPEEKPVTSGAFEEWRANIGETWPVEVAAAVATCMAAAGDARVALLGFCFGGGRVVDALGNARTDLLEASSAPPATYISVNSSVSSIDEDDEDILNPPAEGGLGAPPPRPAYTCGVAFYGTRIDPATLARVRHPLMLNFAGEDALVPPEAIEEMRSVRARRGSGGGAGGDPVQFHVERGAPHGFVHQAGKQGEAGDRVLGRAVLFLRKHLLQESGVDV